MSLANSAKSAKIANSANISNSKRAQERFLPPDRDQRHWDGLSASSEAFRIFLSESACREFREYANSIDANTPLEDIEPASIEPTTFEPAISKLAQFAAEVEHIRTQLDVEKGIVIIDAIAELTSRERQIESWTISRLLGTPLVQSSEGNRLVHVYDRDRTKRMEDGARYHQTRQGGSIHTDNVNAPEPWEYLVFGCLEPAMLGGESIIVNGYSVHSCLKETAADALQILEEDFVWEYRGIADDVYRAPIVTYGPNGDPYFRYLRPYLESAHRKVDQPLTDGQIWAIDVLDSILESSDLQIRHPLLAGEILITFDSQIFHGRTPFADHPHAVEINNFEPGKAPLRRTFGRTWVRSDRLTRLLASEGVSS